jgi:L-ascorbate metabolism protein UlaG (beta-lactamase superfamily)
MKITQVRNATLLLDYAGTRFLIDPMLSAKGAFPEQPAAQSTGRAAAADR